MEKPNITIIYYYYGYVFIIKNYCVAWLQFANIRIIYETRMHCFKMRFYRKNEKNNILYYLTNLILHYNSYKYKNLSSSHNM